MKRIISIALAILTILPLILITPVSAEDDVIYVGYSSPAICTDVGTRVDLKKVSVQFEYGANPAPAGEIQWTNKGTTLIALTPTQKGVFPLEAYWGGYSRTVYIVAKNADETDYVLYENDFSAAPDMSQFRVIQQPSGTTFGYDEAEGAIYLDTSNDGANHMRVLLPSYLDNFGDAIFSARVKITKQTAASRFGAMIFRLQDPSGKKIPYMQTAFRYNISADNGLEIAERTSGDKWNVTQKTSVSGISGGSYFDVTANFCGDLSTSTVNGKTYLTEKNTPYNAGAMGFQVRGARLTVDSVKITVNPESKVSKPEPQLRDTRDPESNIALEPALITEVKTSAELKALETTLPSIAILDAAFENNTFGVILDGKFTKVEDAAVCERVIPAYRVDSSSEALALGQYAKSLELCDAYVIASDPALIKDARSKCNMLYGMLDATNFTYNDDEDLRGKLIECGARGAILSDAQANRNFVSYLQDRYLVAWQIVTEKDISAVSAINNGVLGLVTPDVKATEECFTKYYGKNTLIRTPEIIGHRGVPSKAQENSLAGAELAFELGATMVECDIYLMKDGNIVIMHDSTLDRTTNGSGNTASQTAETIKNYVIDSYNGASQPIPLLDDFFEKFAGTGEVIVIELKSSDTKMAAPLANLIKKYKMERQVVVIAFNKSMIDAIRKADPAISVNFLTSDINADESRSLEVAKSVLSNVIPINTAYSPNQSSGTLGPNLYTDLAVRGVTLWNWTVNDQDNFNSYFISGIRGITTNYSQWAQNYVEDFSMHLSTDGIIELTATTYSGGTSSTNAAELVVIGGTGTYESTGQVTLSEDAEGFFFRLKKTLTNGTSYYVVTPVMLKSDYHLAEPLPETSEEITTDAPEITEPVTGTEPAEEKGCGSMLSLSILALAPAAVLIIKKKED